MPFVEANGVCLHTQRGRAPEKKPLVFINSLGTDFRIWRRLAHELRGRFGFLYYDKRGHGLSSPGGPPWTMEGHVSDLAALMDVQGIKDAIICGISVGGQIALGLSAARPDLVSALVLCDTAHKIGTHETWDARIAQVSAEGIASVWPLTEKAWFTEAFRKTRACDVTGWRNMVVNCPVGGYIGTCMAIRDTDYEREARAVRAPTLVLCGDSDGSTPPALVKGMAEIIPGAEYHEIENAAHMICIEQPAAMAGRILDFAERHGLA